VVWITYDARLDPAHFSLDGSMYKENDIIIGRDRRSHHLGQYVRILNLGDQSIRFTLLDLYLPLQVNRSI
jgi:hypothetical protein